MQIAPFSASTTSHGVMGDANSESGRNASSSDVLVIAVTLDLTERDTLS